MTPLFTIWYNIAIWLYFVIARILALFQKKAKKFVTGRKNCLDDIAVISDQIKGCIWIHCASLGEYEQAVPIMNNLKRIKPEQKILLSFFSPSGYEHVKKGAFDYKIYLPTDNKKNALWILEIIDPKVILFIKYEFWFHLIYAANQKKVPTLLISAVFNREQAFFKWYGKPFRGLLQQYQHIFVQNIESKKLLGSIDIKEVTINGDTRFDRVKQLRKENFEDEILAKFKTVHNLFICGSTYASDHQLIAKNLEEFSDDWKIIIAPHNIDENTISQLEHELPRQMVVRYSSFEENQNSKILILDNIGKLKYIYRLAELIYIGGGFDYSVHNLLEPSIYGKAVFFGNNIRYALEATQLLNANAALQVKTKQDFGAVLKKLLDEKYRVKIGKAATVYHQNQTNSTKLISTYLVDNISI